MRLTVVPGKPLLGEVRLPGDKSISHRAALLGALAHGESCCEHFLVAGVTQVLLQAISDLGVRWDLQGETLTLRGEGLEGLRPSSTPLDCGSSATTLRFLAGALAAAGVPAVLDGSPGLRRRPMDRIVAPLQEMGVPIEASSGGVAPLTLAARPEGRKLRAIDFSLPVASAQVKSALLLAALGADGHTVLHEPGPGRDHTERMLASMGASITCWPENDGQAIRIEPPHPLQLDPLHMTLPGDFSAAAFLTVAALTTPGSQVLLRDVGLNPTRTGLLEALLEMGADIRVERRADQGGEPVGDLTVRHSRLHGTKVRGQQVVRMIDEFPAFAIAAAFANGQTMVSQAEELRYKESDRIASLVGELRKIGVPASETADGFVLPGGIPPLGGSVDPHGDHRLAMALAVAGLGGREAVEIQNAEIIAESFPDFVATLQSLGAEMRVA